MFFHDPQTPHRNGTQEAATTPRTPSLYPCFNRPTESVLPPLISSSIKPPTPYGHTEGLSSPGPPPAQTYGDKNGQSDAGQQQPTSANSQGGHNAAGMGGKFSQPVCNHSLRKAKSPITLLLICIAGSILYKMGFWSDEPKEKKTKENDGEKDAKEGSERLNDEEKKPMERMDEDGDGVC